MELFDKLSDTIVSVSKDATQKAKDISELARIRMEIRSKKDYMNKLYLEIGRIYYESHKDGDVQEFDVNDQMALIQDAQEALEELKKQLGQIKGTVTCTNCGQDMPIEADYCSKCGTKLDKEFFEEETETEEAEDSESEMEAGKTDAVQAEESDAAGSDTTESDAEAVEEVKVEVSIDTEGKDEPQF